MQTSVWLNKKNGHHITVTGCMAQLNGKPVDEIPEWVKGLPDYIFGEMRKWHGGHCPVEETAIVRCVFRGRRPYIGPAIYPMLPDVGKEAMWRHAPFKSRVDPAMDIVGYQMRVV